MNLPDKKTTVIFAVYFLTAAVFAWFYRYQWNTDGLGYLSIAKNYAAGNFSTAVNGFWSPLYSWLVAIFILLGIPAMAAGKIVGVISGFLFLAAAKKLIDCFDLGQFYPKTVFAALILISVYCAVSLTTPDALAAALAVFYLTLVFKKDYLARTYGFWAGVLGGLAYLAKTYFFLFFAVHFALFNAVLFFSRKSPEERKNLVFNFIGGLAAFCVICGAWGLALHAKYGEYTLGKTGGYNLAAYGPGAAGDPLDYLGLLPPAGEHSLSAWDDPGMIQIVSDANFSLTQKLQHYAANFVANSAKLFIVIYSRFSVLALIFFILAFWRVFRSIRKGIFLKDYVFLIGTILILPLGYFPVHIEERYVWAGWVLLFALALRVMRDSAFFVCPPRFKKIAVAVLILSFAFSPLYKLITRIGTGQEHHIIYEQIKDAGISGRIASNARWPESLILAYYAQGSYFGIPKPENIENQLVQNQIDYYIFWEGFSGLPEFLQNKPPAARSAVLPLEVYRLR